MQTRLDATWNSPQSFALDEVDVCGKCYPQPTAFDRLHLDREFFLANVIGQVNISATLSWASLTVIARATSAKA